MKLLIQRRGSGTRLVSGAFVPSLIAALMLLCAGALWLGWVAASLVR